MHLPAERISDWLNPIFVKETRQALKSRQFIATFLLLLTASWLASSLGMLMAGSEIEYQSNGRAFFSAYYAILAFAIDIVVPFAAFRSVVSERDLFTFELLSITTLKPRQVVLGKLQSALLQVFIYFSAITPFIAFTYLLKGIDVLTIVFVLAASLFWSMMISMAALGISTVARQRTWQSLLTIGVLVALALGWGMALQSVFGGLFFVGLAFDRSEFWVCCGVTLLYGGLYFWLFFQLAVAQLTFESDNRSTGVRLAVAALFWTTVALSTGLLESWAPGLSPSSGFLQFWSLLMLVHWLVLGLASTTEPDFLSRRIRRRLPRSRIVRLALAPLLPGGARGLLFVLGHVALLWMIVAVVSAQVPAIDRAVQSTVGGACCYALVYLGLATAFARWGRAVSSEFRPAHARAAVVLLAAVGSLLPHLVRFLEIRRMELSPLFYITDPVSTLQTIDAQDDNRKMLLLVLAAVSVLCLAINTRALLAGVMEIVNSTDQPPPVPRPALEAAPPLSSPPGESLPTSAAG